MTEATTAILGGAIVLEIVVMVGLATAVDVRHVKRRLCKQTRDRQRSSQTTRVRRRVLSCRRDERERCTARKRCTKHDGRRSWIRGVR